MLLVDISPSLDFGSAGRSKREAAVELAALVAFSATQNDDKIGLLLFHGATEAYIPPRKGGKHALRVVREVLQSGDETASASEARRKVLAHGRDATGGGLDGVSGAVGGDRRMLRELGRDVLARFRRMVVRRRQAPARSTHIALALEFCRRVLPRRAVLFLVSDFLDEDYLPALTAANRKHDVVCAAIGDRREDELGDSGLMTVEDAETGQRRLIDTGSAAFRAAMASAAAERRAALASSLGAAGIDLIRIDATRPVVEPLLRFFRVRERRLRR